MPIQVRLQESSFDEKQVNMKGRTGDLGKMLRSASLLEADKTFIH